MADETTLLPATATSATISPRIEEVRTERRRRADIVHGGKLGVDHALLDHTKFAYRWINDSAGRIEALTKRDDWDILRDPSIPDEKGHTEGSQVRQLVGAKQDGSPLYAYLCRKPIEYHRKDRAEKQKRPDEIEAQIKRGVNTGANVLSTTDPNVYVPASGISLGTPTADPRNTKNYQP